MTDVGDVYLKYFKSNQQVNLEGPEHRRLPPKTRKTDWACTTGKLIEKGKCTLSQKSSLNDAVKLRNTLPLKIQNSENSSLIKCNSKPKEYAKTLPIYSIQHLGTGPPKAD